MRIFSNYRAKCASVGAGNRCRKRCLSLSLISMMFALTCFTADAEDGAWPTTITGTVDYEPPVAEQHRLRTISLDVTSRRVRRTADLDIDVAEVRELKEVPVSPEGTFQLSVPGVTAVRFERSLRATAGVIDLPYAGRASVAVQTRVGQVAFPILLTRTDVATVSITVSEKKALELPERIRVVLLCAPEGGRYSHVAGGTPNERGEVLFSVPSPGKNSYMALVSDVPGKLRGDRSKSFDLTHWPEQIALSVERLKPSIVCSIAFDGIPSWFGVLKVLPDGQQAPITREGTCTFYNLSGGEHEVVLQYTEVYGKHYRITPACNVSVSNNATEPINVQVHICEDTDDQEQAPLSSEAVVPPPPDCSGKMAPFPWLITVLVVCGVVGGIAVGWSIRGRK